MVAPADTGAVYRRRTPETFLAQLHASDRQLPSQVERELRAYLDCGIPAHGFLRVRCQDWLRQKAFDELKAHLCGSDPVLTP